jgi:hypothetical protein
VVVQETVAVPELVMLLGEIGLQVRPLGTVSVRETIPVKPARALTIMVETGDWPTLVGVGWDAEIEKSGVDGTETVTVVEWEREPLTPVTVTL